MEKVNLTDTFGLFSDHWRPKIVGELNGQHVKLVKFQGEFVWHSHEHEDEMFLVVAGRFRMEFRDRTVPLEAGEFLIVPRGVEHRPVADEEVQVMLFEPATTLNTGNAEKSAYTAEVLERLGPDPAAGKRMELTWNSPTSFQVGLSTFTTNEAEPGIYLMKSRHMIETFRRLLPEGPKNIAEIGTFTGGSSIFLYEHFQPKKLVCVDARIDMPRSTPFVRERGLQASFRLYPNISQGDRRQLHEVLDREFGSEPLDLVIDDASHLYSLSKSCFETLYPRLREGGLYILEDWGWAHWAGAYQEPGNDWASEPALTNLLMEFLMLSASRPDILPSMEFTTAEGSTMAILRKGPAHLTRDFRVEDSYFARSRRLQPI